MSQSFAHNNGTSNMSYLRPSNGNNKSARALIVASFALTTMITASGAFLPHPSFPPHSLPRQRSSCSSASSCSSIILQAHHGQSSSLNYSHGDDVLLPPSPKRDNRTAAATTRTKPPQRLPNGGRITLVGAGPGLPDLLTLAAHRVLSDPDALVVVDRLVSKEIREVVAGEVRVARKYPGCAEQAQEEIYEWCKGGLREGRHVVRLKIGDPFVFGRGGEEVLEFRKFGVDPVVIPVSTLRIASGSLSRTSLPNDTAVLNYSFLQTSMCHRLLPINRSSTTPKIALSFTRATKQTHKHTQGVSAAFSAPLLGSIPVTHRGISNQVVMCTGYGRDNTSPDLIRYHEEQTVVFLMAVGRLRELCRDLVSKAGYPKDTPVGIVERAGCPEQRTVVGTMDTIADLAERYDVKPPSTIVVGEVVNVLLTEEDYDSFGGEEGVVVGGGGVISGVADWQSYFGQ